MRLAIISLFLCVLSVSSLAQTIDSVQTNLQLQVREDMLNLKSKGLKKDQVYSASLKLEQLVNASVSASVITQKMIEQTGALNIAEALRLAPGVLVQQKTNGNYEVHLRHSFSSLDNQLQDTPGQQLLVVIDHIPQYDYLFGGILWEALPIDLHDITRIEIIRSPSVVFFGSTAINGVIHIFTKHPEDNDLKLSLQSQAGSSVAQLQSSDRSVSNISRGALSFGLNDKFRFRVSGHYHFLNRFQEDYFLLSENRYIPSDSLLFFKQNAPKTNLNTRLAQVNMGLNALVVYKPSEKVFLSTQFTFQESQAQTIQSDDTLALAQRQSNVYGVHLNAHFYGFHLSASQSLGNKNYALGYAGNNFETGQSQASLNYLFTRKSLQLQSGVGFLQTDNKLMDEVVNSEPTLSQNRLVGYHAFTKADVTLLPKWRIVAAIRGDKYESASPVYLSYQLSSSFKIKNHFLRGSYTYNEGLPLARSFRHSMAHTLIPGLNPHKAKNLEIGWNTRIASKINTSLEVFQSHFTLGHSFLASTPSQGFEQHQSSFMQLGASGRAHIWFNKIQIEGFVTVQQAAETWGQLQSDRANHTPQLYGGISLNYLGLLGKLNANIQANFYDQYEFRTQYGNIQIPSRTLLNLKISYKIWRENSLFFNARNLLNTNQKEYVFADRVAGLYLLGLKINI